MSKVMLLLILGSWATTVLSGQTAELPVEPPRAPQHTGKVLWRASVAALAAANAMDIRSSWGKNELNPLLSGNNRTFGSEGALLKLGIVGGTFVLESLVLRHHPKPKIYRSLAFVNFGVATVTGATAIRNFGVPRP